LNAGDHPKVASFKLAQAYAGCADKKDDVTEYAESIEKKFNVDKSSKTGG